MKTTEDIFCESFYPWWRNQTAPYRMTREKANKHIADCRQVLKAKLVPDQMAQNTFDEHMASACKVILFGVSWDEARTKSIFDLQKEHQIPQK